MDVQRVIIPDPTSPLLVTAKKYTIPTKSPLVSKPAVLIFGHGTGLHKETWEPCIEHLFHLDLQQRRIAEIWSVDCQHHGEGAIVNAAYLAKFSHLTCEQYGMAFLLLVHSGHITDIKNRSVVMVGHSGGACAGILSTCDYPLTRLPYSSMIMVEPPMVPQEVIPEEQCKQVLLLIAKAINKRRESWPDRQTALEFISSRKPWKTWQPKILELFLEYGIKPLPTPSNPAGVTLCCSNEVEVGIHTKLQTMYDSLTQLAKISKHMPVHAIFGGEGDYRPQEVKDAICDPSSGRIIASIHTIDGTGHSVVQEKPEQLAAVITDILRSTLISRKAKM